MQIISAAQEGGPCGTSPEIKVEKKQKENLLENWKEIQKPEIHGIKK